VHLPRWPRRLLYGQEAASVSPADDPTKRIGGWEGAIRSAFPVSTLPAGARQGGDELRRAMRKLACTAP